MGVDLKERMRLKMEGSEGYEMDLISLMNNLGREGKERREPKGLESRNLPSVMVSRARLKQPHWRDSRSTRGRASRPEKRRLILDWL